VTQDVVGVLGSVDRNRHLVDIPVVFNIVADPVGAGLVDGLIPTGRNVTGVSHLVPLRDQISAMQRFATVRKLGVIYNVSEVNSLLALRIFSITNCSKRRLAQAIAQARPRSSKRWEGCSQAGPISSTCPPIHP
jgi:hypothetical protein